MWCIYAIIVFMIVTISSYLCRPMLEESCESSPMISALKSSIPKTRPCSREVDIFKFKKQDQNGNTNTINDIIKEERRSKSKLRETKNEIDVRGRLYIQKNNIGSVHSRTKTIDDR